MSGSHRHPNLLLDFLIVALGSGLAIAASKLGLEAGHPATKGLGAVLGGLYIVYLGVLFLLSSFFPGACFVFIFLGFVCEACSRPAGRGMAWFYFALSLAVGSFLLLVGFGVL
jgi:hypothetical protein